MCLVAAGSVRRRFFLMKPAGPGRLAVRTGTSLFGKPLHPSHPGRASAAGQGPIAGMCAGVILRDTGPPHASAVSLSTWRSGRKYITAGVAISTSASGTDSRESGMAAV